MRCLVELLTAAANLPHVCERRGAGLI